VYKLITPLHSVMHTIT